MLEEAGNTLHKPHERWLYLVCMYYGSCARNWNSLGDKVGGVTGVNCKITYLTFSKTALYETALFHTYIVYTYKHLQDWIVINFTHVLVLYSNVLALYFSKVYT